MPVDISYLTCHALIIGRQIDQPRIRQGPSRCEVVQVLILPSRKAKHAVHDIVEKAADAAALKTGRLAGQIECLADHATLPEKLAVIPWPIFLQRLFKQSQHDGGKASVRGYVLAAGCLFGGQAAIALGQQIKLYILGRSRLNSAAINNHANNNCDG